jgi:hypothetical protein
MALSNYEKQKRWREKNRALYNFQQRERRKNLSGGVENALTNSNRLIHGEDVGGEKEKSDGTKPTSESSVSPAQTSKDETLLKLRDLMRVEQEKPAVEPPAKPMVYRSDFGAVITERQWLQLQEKKRKAKEGGYEIDAYSQ